MNIPGEGPQGPMPNAWCLFESLICIVEEANLAPILSTAASILRLRTESEKIYAQLLVTFG